MRTIVALAFGLAISAAGCLWAHVSREIPPPGGCDQCHRQKIASNWEVGIAPVALGKDGGIPEDRDVILRELQTVPYHKEVSTKRLAVFAANAAPEAVGDPETGIQCFVCHRSPGPPHEELRGSFRHPWTKGPASGE